MDKKNTYEVIGNELDNRIKKRDKVIEGIKGELFDVLTLGEEEKSREEVGGQVIDELNTKLAKATNKNPQNLNYINSLKVLIKDVEKRIATGKQTEILDKKGYINTNLGNFDKKVIESIISSILDQAKKSENIDDVLILRVIGNDKYKKELFKSINEKIEKGEISLDDNNNKNFKTIMNKFFGEEMKNLENKNVKYDLEEVIYKAKKNGEYSIKGKLKSNLAKEKYKELDEKMNNSKELVENLGDFLEIYLKSGGKMPEGENEGNENNKDKEKKLSEYTEEEKARAISIIQGINGISDARRKVVDENTINFWAKHYRNISELELCKKILGDEEMVNNSFGSSLYKPGIPFLIKNIDKIIEKLVEEGKGKEDQPEGENEGNENNKDKEKKLSEYTEEEKARAISIIEGISGISDAKRKVVNEDTIKRWAKHYRNISELELCKKILGDEEMVNNSFGSSLYKPGIPFLIKNIDKIIEKLVEEGKGKRNQPEGKENQPETKAPTKTETEKPKEGQLPPELREDRDILDFISKDTGIPIDDLKDKNKYRIEFVSIGDNNAEDDGPIGGYRVYKEIDKSEPERKAPTKTETEKPKEGALPADSNLGDEKAILDFISKDTGIPIDDLKDENKYRIEFVPISDNNAEDDGPIGGYRVYKKKEQPEEKKEQPEEKKEQPEEKKDKLEEKKEQPEEKKDKLEEKKDKPEEKKDKPDSLKLKEQRERVATISNVTQINRAICQREADEELRQRHENVGWNIFDRANLFLRRKYIKDRIVNKKMGGNKDKFVMDWSESGQSAADRHQIEQQNAFAERMNVVIQDIDADNYPETRRRLDKLLVRLTGNKDTVPPRQREISDSQFQTEFTNIMKQSGEKFDKTRPSSATSTNWRPISEIIKSNNIEQLSTNILMQANKFRTQQEMTWNIVDHVNKNPAESSDDFDKYCRGEIQKFVNEFNDMPDFLQQMGLSLDKTDDIKTLKGHMGALSTIQAQSLKLRIQMLDDGGEAYNVKKTGGLLTKIGRILDDPTGGKDTKFGRWMNKHQNLKEAFGRIWGTAKVGVMVTPALLLAPAGPLAVALGVGGTSFLTTLFKKKSHYEKEHRSYQRMQATNLEDYRARREELANEVAGMKRYQGRFWGKKARDRRQYRDYVKTTQDQMSLSPDLVSKITKRLNSANALSGIERTNLVADVADGLARLDYHKKTGQNFLGSNNPSTAEKEYRELQNAVMGGAKRLGLVDANGNPDMNQIRNNSPYDAYYNNTIDIIENGCGDDYNNQGYLKARKKFKKRSNTKAWAGAFKAGAISFGLSYLASSLASHNKTTTVDTYTSQHHGKVGGEYNPGDMQEHLFVSGDVNPTMNSVINSNTSEITGCQLYSSVDAIPCSAAKGAAELSAANADLAAALSNPVVSGNPNLVSAVHNYITDATTKIGMIPGLDAGNHDLSLARAIEAVKEGILDPVISSGNSSVVVNPTGFTRLNGGVQSSAVGIVGQSFRNMGVTGIDYIQHGTEQVVEHVTRAIPIPVGLNTFGESKKKK